MDLWVALYLVLAVVVVGAVAWWQARRDACELEPTTALWVVNVPACALDIDLERDSTEDVRVKLERFRAKERG